MTLAVRVAAPWSVKNMPLPIREKATRYARQHGVPMAEWLSLAIERQCAAQDGVEVLPPAGPGPTHAGQSLGKPGMTSGVTLGDAAEWLTAMAQAAAAGLPVSKTAVRDVLALVRSDFRVARGMAISRPRHTLGRTIESDVSPEADPPEE
jgi:hypothetical protein